MLCPIPRKIKVGALKHKATTSGIALVPCGQCLNCRINQARIWTNRIILEATQWPDTSFVTLTYDDWHLPDPPIVQVPVMQKYLKRFRYYSGKKIKYYAVGEYGEENKRPHYHIVMFGVHPVADWSSLAMAWKGDDGCLNCAPERLQALELTPELARYEAGYITKKAKSANNTWLFESQKAIYEKGLREWSIMSKGIGKEAIKKIKPDAMKWDHEIKTLRTGGKKYPIGRYLKKFTHKERSWVQSILEFRAGQEKAFDDRLKKVKMAKITNERRKL